MSVQALENAVVSDIITERFGAGFVLSMADGLGEGAGIIAKAFHIHIDVAVAELLRAAFMRLVAPPPFVTIIAQTIWKYLTTSSIWKLFW